VAFWTNKSVLALAGDADPEIVVSAKAEQLALAALSDGWAGPPYDPFELARRLEIPVVARDDLYDARIVPGTGKGFTLEYNPSRPRGRVRFSVAHELAHTLFPDAADQIRYRSSHEERSGDDWQLEMLCNIAASEVLMPTGTFPQLMGESLDIDHLMDVRRQYDVSTEALLLRLTKLVEEPVTMFAASRPPTTKALDGPLRIDYWRGGRAATVVALSRGARVPRESVAYDCTAVGFTAKGVETWPGEKEVRVEAVGIPPYPGQRMPRVVGILRPNKPADGTALRRIEYVTGDATEPRGSGHRAIIHLVNDKTANWGGGFAQALRSRYPKAQEDFREWAKADKSHLRLGEIRRLEIQPDLDVVSIVAQKGYGTSTRPRVRYEALRTALQRLAALLDREPATVHMPRIGAGMAGGDWNIIAELVRDELVDRGHEVTVYSRPQDAWQAVATGPVQQMIPR
jgi:O-acetyl-ADP-ribose deacetylase (regulator of RNase III)